MLIKLSNSFETFVINEVEAYVKKGEDRLKSLRTFYQKICVEPNQKVDSLRFVLAVRHIELITEKLQDDYPVIELTELIQEMHDNKMYIAVGKKAKCSINELKKHKPSELIEEVASIGFNKKG